MRRMFGKQIAWAFIVMGVIGLCYPVAAQQQTLSGVVLDAADGQPLPGVSVYIASTTYGDATDEDGHFTIPGSFESQFELVASLLGYDLGIIELDLATSDLETIIFRLVEQPVELGELEVTAEHPKAWRLLLERLETILFSTTPNAPHCTLLNPEVLSFDYDEGRDVLDVAAEAPLEIENRALGYHITLHGFSLRGNEWELLWNAKQQFRELEPKNSQEERRWRRNRTAAYRGSPRHFLAALYATKGEGKKDSRSVEKAKFSVYQVPGAGIIPKGLPALDADALRELAGERQTDGTRLVAFDGALYVVYGEFEPNAYVIYRMSYGSRNLSENTRTYTNVTQANRLQRSWLEAVSGPVDVDAQGREYAHIALKRFGYWSWERLAELLPRDYLPE